MNTFDKMLWTNACKECGQDFVRKDMPEYSQVLSIYRQSKKNFKINELKETDPAKYRWAKCCDSLNYDFVKRGTPEYEKVMEMYRSDKKF